MANYTQFPTTNTHYTEVTIERDQFTVIVKSFKQFNNQE